MLMRLFCRIEGIVEIIAGGGYTGTLIDWAETMFGYNVEIVKRSDQKAFPEGVQGPAQTLVVERTLAWLSWSRRLSKDYELRHTSSEAMIHIAFAHQLLRRNTWFLDRF